MKPKFNKINKHTNVQAGTAYAMFELARDYLLGICDGYKGGKVILCGGLQINMAKPCEDFFETLFFEVHENGQKIQDLMHVFDIELGYAASK